MPEAQENSPLGREMVPPVLIDMVCCEAWGRSLVEWDGLGLTKLSPQASRFRNAERIWRLFSGVCAGILGCAGVLVGEDGTDGAAQSREAVGFQLLTSPLEQPYPHHRWHTRL